ncbi:MAG: M67 family metallopeptidase [Acidobacteria bacterium]|nr:M67 family metallopeptidase [Acidobacteriota bacterium]
MGVQIEAAVIDSMVEHARLETPLECCGLLMGQAGRITRLRRMRNLAQSPIRYEMAPGELFQFFRDLRGSGLQHLGIYHSHPSSEAYPSTTDIAQAFYPDCTYFILSLLVPGLPSVRAFSIIEGVVAERTIQRI